MHEYASYIVRVIILLAPTCLRWLSPHDPLFALDALRQQSFASLFVFLTYVGLCRFLSLSHTHTPCRSPLLVCICGACRIGRSCTLAYSLVFVGIERPGATGVITLITVPILWVGNGALIAWMVRMLVLYHPKKRKRWGRHVNEKRVARALCWTYFGMEAAFWIGVALYGIERWLRSHGRVKRTLCPRFNR